MEMTDEAILQHLNSVGVATSIGNATKNIPHAPGLYAIFVDHCTSLPAPFCQLLMAKQTTLLYVGRAKDSLFARLLEQELNHKNAATFFRGIGAALGFRPAPGSLAGMANKNNYSFSRPDTANIIKWNLEHLRVRWLSIPPADVVRLEPYLIRSLAPLFNTLHNRNPCVELATLRKECRKIACI